jgi:hypothetical protein
MAKMVHVGFVLIIFTKKIPLMSSYGVEKGKGTYNNNENGHDSKINTRKSLSKSRTQSSNKGDFGTPSDGEVFFTYVGKYFSQDLDLDLKVIGLIFPYSQPPQPIIQAQKDRATSSQYSGEILVQPPKMPLTYHHAYN